MRSWTAVAALTLLCGCATTGGMRSTPLDTGVSRQYAGDFEIVFRATRAAITNAGLAIESYDEIDETTALIVAKKGASAFSWGELVRVVVQSTAPDKVTVRVLTKRKLATNVTARGDYSETIFSNIDLQLR